MKKVYRGWKVLQAYTGLGYDPATDKVVYSDEAWQSFIKVHKKCKHLHYEGLRNKELYYNVFKKTHAADALGGRPNPEHRWAAGQHATKARCCRSVPISWKCSDSDQSVRKDGILQCMNIMKGMGIPPHHRTMMWHYFDSHPHLQGPFCQLDDEDRRKYSANIVENGNISMNEHGSAAHHEDDNHGSENAQRDVDDMLAMAVVAATISRRNRRRAPVPIHNSSLTAGAPSHRAASQRAASIARPAARAPPERAAARSQAPSRVLRRAFLHLKLPRTKRKRTQKKGGQRGDKERE
ncbi:hypothetical protein TIFTF001_029002 [Ficus carica]|uniref:Uncharacterized protein n=1 Tax=Ficus carica TaxID=3494 RepID=A0AA88DRL2_FICCA|nr:hypothetical protein TIFTF001_029002 [Ficus carica]